MTKEDWINFSYRFDDPAILELDLKNWNVPNPRTSEIVHKDGHKIGLTGPVGRWRYYVIRNGRYWHSRGSFKTASAAIRSLRRENLGK